MPFLPYLALRSLLYLGIILLELGGATQGLAGAHVRGALLGVVDDYDGDAMAALHHSIGRCCPALPSLADQLHGFT